jgi:Flp pilus assembly protein TadG
MRPLKFPRERGIAAIELALLLPLLVMMLAFPVYLGRVFWHYTVIEHAAQDAARYLSKVPVSEMANPARAATVTAVVNQIVAAELAELAPGAHPYALAVACDSGVCIGFNKPITIVVNIRVLMQDVLFPGSTDLTLPIEAYVTYPYLGR